MSPQSGTVLCGMVRNGLCSTAKSWAEPSWAVPIFSGLLRWGTKRWKGAEELELHKPSVDWSTESSLPWNKQTQYPQAISGQRRYLCLLEKMSHKSLPSFFDILHCCLLFNVSRSSSLIVLAGYPVSHCYDVAMLTYPPRLSPSGLNPAQP